jgi:glycosyltransferase involved in cell wall biosynthesis
MTKVSYITVTARSDYPYLGRPDLHLFQPTLEALKSQTNTDFEWIIVDTLYHTRKDFFKHLNLPFKVKHVPAQPNFWIDHGLPGISTQYNKGIIYSDGELLFFTSDGYMFPSNFIENMWCRYRQGYLPIAWYIIDWSFHKPIDEYLQEYRFDVVLKKPSDTSVSPNPVQYDFSGYNGKTIELEHRYTYAFKDNSLDVYPGYWSWWFSLSSASLEAMLKINGFDEKLDGDRSLMDCDAGSRLELAGYGIRFALFRDFFIVRAATTPRLWNPNFIDVQLTIKCNYALLGASRDRFGYKANIRKLDDADIGWIKEVFCKQKCTVRDYCQKNHAWQYPFEHKAGYPGHHSCKKWFNFWMKHQTLTDLTSEREKRLKGDPKYSIGTFS